MTEQSVQDAACAPHTKATDHHARFKPFVGSFAAEVKMFMGAGEPNVSTGTMTNTLELDGLFLRQEYLGDAPDNIGGKQFPNFRGSGWMGYNTVTNRYEGFWIDNVNTQMQLETGSVDSAGKTWTMIGSVLNPQSGKKMTKRSVVGLKDNDHHAIEMFFEIDGKESKVMEINYTRKR